MKLKFYGVRGSTPVCEAGFQQFGGNTTCFQLTSTDSNRIAIIDAGTGLRNLGRDMREIGHHQDHLIIAFTHFHWDHMQYFPVQLDMMGAQFEFLKVEDASKHFSSVNNAETTVTGQRHNHPGGAYGFRIESKGKVLVICTDVEHGEEIDPKVVELSRGADLLVHDAQYTAEELRTHRGWGHSSFDQAMQVAEMAGVKRLAMTHHDAEHDDDFLLRMEKLCQGRFPNTQIAREGMEIVL